jgi:hypothetical protein
MTNGATVPRVTDAAVALTTAIAMTTGGNPTLDRATAMTTTPGPSVVVQETIGKPLTTTAATIVMMHVGGRETVTVVSAIERGVIRSLGTSICRAD